MPAVIEPPAKPAPRITQRKTLRNIQLADLLTEPQKHSQPAGIPSGDCKGGSARPVKPTVCNVSKKGKGKPLVKKIVKIHKDGQGAASSPSPAVESRSILAAEACRAFMPTRQDALQSLTASISRIGLQNVSAVASIPEWKLRRWL